MTSFAFCSSFYESARPYLAACMSGMAAAGEGHDCVAVIALDGLVDAARTLTPLAAAMPIHTIDAPSHATIATVRATMLMRACEIGADALVLVDADDWPLDEALRLHGDALAEADFSYGDMAVVDRLGNSVTRNFYDGSDVPQVTVDPAQIRYRNWLGFSNTAVRCDRIPEDALSVPEGITAVDWWFYTLLLRHGAKGQRTRAPVVAYRMHDANILGASPARTTEALRKRCDIVLQHCDAFMDDAALAALAERVRALQAKLSSPSRELQVQIESVHASPGVWHEDVMTLLSQNFPETLKSGAAQ